eukprot:ctg_1760.g382
MPRDARSRARDTPTDARCGNVTVGGATTGATFPPLVRGEAGPQGLDAMASALVRVDVADKRERSRPGESPSDEGPSSPYAYTWWSGALQSLSEGVNTATPRLETRWVNFRADNPAIPSEIITGKVHLYRIVEAATDGRRGDAAAAALRESKPAPTDNLSNGDEVARAILQAKSAATGAEQDATPSASEDTAATKSGPCSLDAHSAMASNGHSSTVSSSAAFGR